MRKILIRFVWLVLIGIPTLSFATWQISNPNPAQKTIDPTLGKTDYPLYYYKNNTVTLYPKKGLLMDNVKRMAAEQGWRLVWKGSQDYSIVQNTEISGPTFIVVMDRLLNHYPLRATYNKNNHTMTVVEFTKQ